MPQGLDSSRALSKAVGEYIPNNVEEVRFMMDPLRLMLFNSASLGLRKSGFAGSAGVGASEDSGVRLKARRGRGRRIRSSDMIVESRL